MSDNLDARRLERSRSDHLIAGVCGGIAEYFSVDANLVRLLFVIACFFGGAGALVYALGWLLLPAAGESTSIAQRLIAQYRKP